MKIKKISLIATLACTLLASCNKNILDLDNPSQNTISNYFKTIPEIEKSVNAIYAGFYFRGIISHEGFQGIDALGNELDGGPSSTGETDIIAFYNYTFNNSSPVVLEMWKGYYRIVLRANLTLKVTAEYLSKNGPSDVINRYQGEAYFLRAWAYSKLVNNWGRVPIRDQYDQGENINAPRKPVEEVWALVESDLAKAKQLLPNVYSDGKDLGRATKGAAVALLGQAYLYQKKYAKSEIELATLDQSPFDYDVLDAASWSNNFGENNENNKGSVFEVQFGFFAGNFPWGPFVDNGNETEATQISTQFVRSQLYGFNDWSNWKFPAHIVPQFSYNNEAGVKIIDPRATLTFYGNAASGADTTWCDNCGGPAKKFDFATKGYWYKKYCNYEFKSNENNMQTGNNERLLRYSNILLMRAESKLFLNDIPGGIALMNRIREKIGVFKYTAANYNQVQAIELLKRERILELIGEHTRFDDLRRWGTAKEVLNNEMFLRNGQRNFQDKNVLLPIPLTERDNNPAIKDDVVNDWN